MPTLTGYALIPVFTILNEYLRGGGNFFPAMYPNKKIYSYWERPLKSAHARAQDLARTPKKAKMI